MKRGQGRVPALIAIALVVVVAALLAGVLLAASREPRRPAAGRAVRSRTGGFSVVVPAGWKVEHLSPSGSSVEYLTGREPGLFVRFGRAGFWVNRWPRGASTVDGVVAELAPGGRPRNGGDVRVLDLGGGRKAVEWTYTKAKFGPLSMVTPLGRLDMADYRIIEGSSVYNIGFWMSDRDEFSREVDAMVRSFEVFGPSGRTISRADPGFSIEIPADWMETKPTLPAAVVTATGERDWLYVFVHPRTDPEQARAHAAENLKVNGATDLLPSSGSTVAGRAFLRLDFRFPDERQTEPAYDTEWFLPDGAGGTLVVAVGRLDAASRAHEAIIASLRFLK